MQYSDLEIFRLNEGYFSVGVDKVFLPTDPKAYLPPRSLFVAINPFLIKAPEDILLLDCGLGAEAEGRSITHLVGQLSRHGVQREDVTKVLLSHLHFDHVGGAIYQMLGEDVPTFPNAEYYVQQAETKASYTGKSATFRDRVVEALDRAGQLVLLDGDEQISDSIRARVTGGHTEAHQIFTIESLGRTVLYGGDVLPQPSQVNRRFRAKYDFDAERSQQQRTTLAQEAVENGYLVLFYHSTQEPACFISSYSERNGYSLDLLSLQSSTIAE
jgi:glyoxylase-like metal-dependent hydrolase (beta-lactamase superfamily II)